MSRRVERFEIAGAAGALEARIDWPAGTHRAAALLCHPHPLHGGTMHTKALARTARSLVRLGISTLRFNFRGVGHSAGHFSGGPGELDDAARALDTLIRSVGPSPLLLGGFSFGSHVALRLGNQRAQDLPVVGLLGIAPPLDLFDFSFLESSRLPLLLAVGDADPFCPLSTLQAFQAGRKVPAVLEVFPAAGHLLLEQLDALEDAVRRFAQDLLTADDAHLP